MGTTWLASAKGQKVGAPEGGAPLPRLMPTHHEVVMVAVAVVFASCYQLMTSRQYETQARADEGGVGRLGLDHDRIDHEAATLQMPREIHQRRWYLALVMKKGMGSLRNPLRPNQCVSMAFQ
jgi:hypothetical protein